MLVKELLEKVSFNDSCVNELKYIKGTVILNIDLCMWKQKDYKDGEPELKEVTLTFLDSKDYKWESDKDEEDIEYDSIIDITFEDKMVKIVLEDEDISILTFKCCEVQMN